MANKKINIRLLDILFLILVVLSLYVTWDIQRDLADTEARLRELEQPRLKEKSGGPPMVATHLISGHFCSEKHEGEVVIFFDNAGEFITWSGVEKFSDIENKEPRGSGEYEVKGSVLKMDLKTKDGNEEAYTFYLHKITRFDGIVSIIGNSETGVFSKERCEQD